MAVVAVLSVSLWFPMSPNLEQFQKRLRAAGRMTMTNQRQISRAPADPASQLTQTHPVAKQLVNHLRRNFRHYQFNVLLVRPKIMDDLAHFFDFIGAHSSS
jgi:hypothetical protein